MIRRETWGEVKDLGTEVIKGFSGLGEHKEPDRIPKDEQGYYRDQETAYCAGMLGKLVAGAYALTLGPIGAAITLYTIIDFCIQTYQLFRKKDKKRVRGLASICINKSLKRIYEDCKKALDTIVYV